MARRFPTDPTPDEAWKRFEAYVAGVPAAIDRLRGLLGRSADPRFHEAVLDFSPESLEVVWEYVLLFLDRYRRRSWSQRFLSSIGFRSLVTAADPRDPSSFDRVLADPDLVDLLDLVSRYVGEAFLRSFPGAVRRLGTATARRRTALYGRVPVVSGLPWEREACPETLVTNLALRALRLDPVPDGARGMLREAFEEYRRRPGA